MGAWRNRDTNDIFAHCSLIFIFYFLDFNFFNFVCPSELHRLIWLFFKKFLRKKKCPKKSPKRLSSWHLPSFVNRTETWYTASPYPSAKYVVTEFLISLYKSRYGRKIPKTLAAKMKTLEAKPFDQHAEN